MDRAIQDLKDLTRDRCTPKPDRSELADLLRQAGAPEGLTMEWIFDRFEYPKHLDRGQP